MDFSAIPTSSSESGFTQSTQKSEQRKKSAVEALFRAREHCILHLHLFPSLIQKSLRSTFFRAQRDSMTSTDVPALDSF
jgi:hypothetical protein